MFTYVHIPAICTHAHSLDDVTELDCGWKFAAKNTQLSARSLAVWLTAEVQDCDMIEFAAVFVYVSIPPPLSACTRVESHASAASLLESREQRYIKAINSNNAHFLDAVMGSGL